MFWHFEKCILHEIARSSDLDYSRGLKSINSNYVIEFYGFWGRRPGRSPYISIHFPSFPFNGTVGPGDPPRNLAISPRAKRKKSNIFLKKDNFIFFEKRYYFQTISTQFETCIFQNMFENIHTRQTKYPTPPPTQPMLGGGMGWGGGGGIWFAWCVYFQTYFDNYFEIVL